MSSCFCGSQNTHGHSVTPVSLWNGWDVHESNSCRPPPSYLNVNDQKLEMVRTDRQWRALYCLPVPLPLFYRFLLLLDLLPTLTPILIKGPNFIFKRARRREEESLLVLHVSFLQMTQHLLLPLSYTLCFWYLPCCCTCVVVYIVGTITIIKTTFPAME